MSIPLRDCRASNPPDSDVWLMRGAYLPHVSCACGRSFGAHSTLPDGRVRLGIHHRCDNQRAESIRLDVSDGRFWRSGRCAVAHTGSDRGGSPVAIAGASLEEPSRPTDGWQPCLRSHASPAQRLHFPHPPLDLNRVSVGLRITPHGARHLTRFN